VKSDVENGTKQFLEINTPEIRKQQTNKTVKTA
jgi:hypothetical protein